MENLNNIINNQNAECDSRVHQHENLFSCKFIYQRKNSKKRINKGERCNQPALISNYTKVEGGYFCRAHAQNEYKKKGGGKKVIKVKRVGKIVKRKTRSSKKNISKNKNFYNITENIIIENNTADESVGIDLGHSDDPIEVANNAEEKDRQIFVHLHANGVSARAVELTANILREEGKISTDISRNTIIRDTVKTAIMTDILCAELLTISEVIGIGFDETSNSDNRSNLEVEIFGRFKSDQDNHWYVKKRKNFLVQENKNKSKSDKLSIDEIDVASTRWSYVLCTQEIVSKESENLLRVFLDRFNELVDFQKNHLNTKKRSSVFDIKYVTADWTNGNFGAQNGFIALFNKERKEVFDRLNCLGDREKEMYNLGEYQDAEAIGCGDHLLNIIFRHAVKNTEKFIPFAKPKAYGYVKNLYKRLVGNEKQIFKGYCYSQNKNPPSFCRMTENRFGSFYIGAQRILENSDLIRGFCEKMNISGEFFNQKEFFGESCQEEVFYMSKVSEKFLLPFMKDVNEQTSSFENFERKKKWMEKLEESLISKTGFLDFWDLTGERRDKLGELYEKHSASVEVYLYDVKQMEKNSFTRCTNQEKNQMGFFHTNLGLKDPIDALYISFCLFIEFTCEAIYCLEQRNIKPKLNIQINSGTNRSGERINGKGHKEYEKNANTNCITIESKFKVKQLFPHLSFYQSYNSHYSIRPFHQIMSKKGPRSYKSLARKRLNENRLKIHQKNKFEKQIQVDVDTMKTKCPIKKKVKEMALKIHHIIQEKSSDSSNPSQSTTQIEDLRDENDSVGPSDSYSPSSSEENEESSSHCFFKLHQKVSLKFLRICISYLRAKNFVAQPKIQNFGKIDVSMDLFIEEAEEFLKIVDFKEYFEITPPIFESSSSLEEDNKKILENSFKKWILNDNSLNSENTEDHILQILKSSENTKTTFLLASSKSEFLKLLKSKFKNCYKNK